MQSARSPRAVVLAGHADGQLRLRDGTMVRLHAIEPGDGAAACENDRVEIAADDGQGHRVGRAAYARVYGPRANVAFEVDDAFWHRGLPEVLLGSLRVRAARRGISMLLARVSASDVRLLALLREQFAARETRDGPYVEAEFSTELA